MHKTPREVRKHFGKTPRISNRQHFLHLTMLYVCFFNFFNNLFDHKHLLQLKTLLELDDEMFTLPLTRREMYIK